VSCADSDILQKLPRSVFRELVERLARGQSLKSVAGWVMTQHRGELQHEGRYAMRKYIAAFACRMKEQEVPPVGNCHGNGDCGGQECKGARNPESEEFARIQLPALTPSQLDLQTKARAMGPTSRMFVNDLASSVRRILKLEKELRDTDAASAPPESSMPDGENK
jgi:hypothetical protein